MADDTDPDSKTEEPTGKRLEQARSQGDVAKSMDLPQWASLAAVCGVVFLSGGWLADPQAPGVRAGPAGRLRTGAHAAVPDGRAEGPVPVGAGGAGRGRDRRLGLAAPALHAAPAHEPRGDQGGAPPIGRRSPR